MAKFCGKSFCDIYTKIHSVYIKKKNSDIFYQKRYLIPTRITLFLYEGCRIITTSASPVWRGTRCLWAQCCKKPRKNAFFLFQQHFSTRDYLCLNWTRSDQHRAWKYYECARLSSLLYRPKGGCIELYCCYVLYYPVLLQILDAFRNQCDCKIPVMLQILWNASSSHAHCPERRNHSTRSTCYLSLCSHVKNNAVTSAASLGK